MKNYYFLLIIFAIPFFISCSKDVDPPKEKPKGQVSFYNILPNNCDTFYIECNNQNGIATKKYYYDSINCGSEGTFTISLDTGTYKYIATCNSIKIEKEVTVKLNECSKIGLGYTIELPDRLLAYISYDKIVEINLLDGNEKSTISTLGSEYFDNFVYIKTLNEIIASSNSKTYKINASTGSLSTFSNDYFESYVVSNSTNNLYGIETSGELYKIDISNGNKTLIAHNIGFRCALLESNNTIYYKNAFGKLYKYEINSNTFVQLSEVSYERLFVSQKQNRLFGYIAYDRIVELDILTGKEIRTIVNLGSDYYTDFVIAEKSKEILCHDNGMTFKINIETGLKSTLCSRTYEDLLIID